MNSGQCQEKSNSRNVERNCMCEKDLRLKFVKYVKQQLSTAVVLHNEFSPG